MTLAPLPVRWKRRSEPESKGLNRHMKLLNLRGLLGNRAPWKFAKRMVTPDGFEIRGKPDKRVGVIGLQCGRCGLRIRTSAGETFQDFAGCDLRCPMGVQP